MKQNLRLILMTLLCAVFSTAWGDTIESNFTDKNLTVGANELEWTASIEANSFETASPSRGVQFGAAKGEFTLTAATSLSDITKVEIICSTNGNASANTISVKVGDTVYKNGDLETYPMPKDNNMTVAFEGAATSGTIVVSCNNTNKSIYFKQIIVTYTPTSSGPVDPKVTVPSDAVTVMVGQTIDNPVTTPDDLAVIYSSSDEAVASVDAYTGEVTGVAVGDDAITITVSWDATNKYNSGSKTYDVNVIAAVEPTVYEKVTKVNQLVAGNEYILVTDNGVALSSQLNDNYRSSENVTIVDNTISVTNQVVTVLTLGGDDNGWTFLASDNNKYLSYGEKQLKSSDDAETWTITDDFQIAHDTYTIQYNSSSPRFACYKGTQKDAYLYVKSGSATSNKEDASVSIDKTELTLAEGEAVTATITTDPSSLVVTYTTSDESVAEVSTSGVVTAKAQGNATITATWAEQTIGETVYRAGNKEFVITVKDPNGKGSFADPYTVAEVIAYNGTVNDVWVKGFIVGYYTSNNELTAGTDGAPDSNIALCDSKSGAETNNTIPVQLPNTFIRTSMKLQNNAGMLGEEVLIKGDIMTYFKKNGIKNTDDGYIILPEISSVGYSTAYYSNADLKVQEGTTAYAVTDNGKQLDYISVGDVIPAGVAVVLQGSGPQKFQIVAAPTTTTDFSQYANNNLKGLDVDGTTVGPDDGSYVYYKLAIGTSTEDAGKIGFYWAEANGAAFQSKAHKAYLVLPASGNVVSSYAFDETVGISSPMLDEIKSEGVYTLSGVRVMSDRLPKGIYIVNGKKMVIK